ncbi:uncharacterized protein ALTATR162_LOCUS3591 [Alternaria atra]|uniref:Uncharacterized protein n=1 Tax=Alternaria atra TaxID=119953 RepID=A0A8J2HWZ7_9PLEO|nr:uncharacterized protein ALTATR162_LOCUS3591 [Alternaria atra]CAG5154396.1 unnamed protein product [Alternaria atra]
MFFQYPSRPHGHLARRLEKTSGLAIHDSDTCAWITFLLLPPLVHRCVLRHLLAGWPQRHPLLAVVA